MKDQGTAAARLCMGCKDAVRPKSHVGSVSHARMWDVRGAQSEQAVNHNRTLNSQAQGGGTISSLVAFGSGDAVFDAHPHAELLSDCNTTVLISAVTTQWS